MNSAIDSQTAFRETIIGHTQSLCPVCLDRIPAVKIKIGPEVHLRKTCGQHGDFSTIIWRGEPDYLSWYKERTPQYSEKSSEKTERGCPYDCGSCSTHGQSVCCAQFEITKRCNLRCPVCFANAGEAEEEDQCIDKLIEQMRILWRTSGKCNIQFSGGEPTLRDDLPMIIESAKLLGFEFFQLNTNGIRLASDLEYACSLKKAGLSTVFLQFDGTEDEIHRRLRGKDLLAIKKQAIENCKRCRLGVVLAPTLVPGVNTNNIGNIVRYALDNMPVIRGVHFQPISYFGRYPSPPSDQDRITLPEVLRLLEIQTHGLVLADNFTYADCEHSICSFHGDFINIGDGKLIPCTDPKNACCRKSSEQKDQVRKAQNYVAKRWQMTNRACCGSDIECQDNDEFDQLLDIVRNRRLSITCMTFQDAENIDLERLKHCCVSVIRNGKAIPFCANNISSREGIRLHR